MIDFIDTGSRSAVNPEHIVTADWKNDELVISLTVGPHLRFSGEAAQRIWRDVREGKINRNAWSLIVGNAARKLAAMNRGPEARQLCSDLLDVAERLAGIPASERIFSRPAAPPQQVMGDGDLAANAMENTER